MKEAKLDIVMDRMRQESSNEVPGSQFLSSITTQSTYQCNVSFSQNKFWDSNVNLTVSLPNFAL